MMKKLILLLLALSFLVSCSSEPYPEDYACKQLSHFGKSILVDDFMELCGPISNKTCTTEKGQEGKYYFLDPQFTQSCSAKRECLTNSDVAQIEVDPMIGSQYFRCTKIKLF